MNIIYYFAKNFIILYITIIYLYLQIQIQIIYSKNVSQFIINLHITALIVKNSFNFIKIIILRCIITTIIFIYIIVALYFEYSYF